MADPLNTHTCETCRHYNPKVFTGTPVSSSGKCHGWPEEPVPRWVHDADACERWATDGSDDAA